VIEPRTPPGVMELLPRDRAAGNHPPLRATGRRNGLRHRVAELPGTRP
jgi:hypothetical protein